MICGQRANIHAAGIACLAGGFLLSTLAGCIHVDQTLTLEKNGSGMVDLTYAMSEESIAQWQDVARNMFDSPNHGNSSSIMPFDFSDQDIRDDFKEYEPDVVLQSVKSETRDGWKYRRMVISFRSLAGLSKAGFLADRNISLVKDARGNYVFTQQAGPEGNLPPELAALDGTLADSLFSGMMQGFRAAIRVKTPGRILETNAPEKSERTARWLFDSERDPDALQKVQQASLRIVFEGKGLDISTFRNAPAKH
jgi:hypothetical protein